MKRFAKWEDSEGARDLWLSILCNSLSVPIEVGCTWPDDFWLGCMRTVLEHDDPSIAYSDATFEDGADAVRSGARSMLASFSGSMYHLAEAYAKPLTSLGHVFSQLQGGLLHTLTPVAAAYREMSEKQSTLSTDTQDQFTLPNLGPSPLEVARVKVLYSIERKLEETNTLQQTAAESTERWSLVIALLTVAVGVTSLLSSLWWRIGILGGAVLVAIGIRVYRVKRKTSCSCSRGQ